jgi:F-type H+-transporting ATPase subunit b
MQGQWQQRRIEQASRWVRLGLVSRVLAATGLGLLLSLAIVAPAQASAALELIPNPPTLIGLILFFIGLVVVTNALIFKPIFKALDERSSRVEGARQRAEEADLESDALLQRYEAAIHEARNEAETKRKNKLGHAREEQLGMAEVARGQAEAQVEAARETLAAALATAREGLKATSREIAQAVATRVIGRDL